MFPTRYYPDRMFAPRYWPKVGAAPAPVDGMGEITPDGARSYIEGSMAISTLGGDVSISTVGGSISGSQVGGSIS